MAYNSKFQKTAGTTIYVDYANGTDSPDKGTGTGTNAYATVQYAIDQLPKYLQQATTIQLANEVVTVTDTVALIQGFSGANLVIQGNSGSRPTAGQYNFDGTSNTFDMFQIYNNSNEILLIGIETEFNGNNGVHVSTKNSFVGVFWMNLIEGSIGIKANYGTNGHSYQCDHNSNTRGIWLNYSSYWTSREAANTAICNSYGLDSGVGSVIVKDGTQPAGTTSNENTSGGGIIR